MYSRSCGLVGELRLPPQLMEYMDEAFIIEAFRSAGEDTVQNVKVMKNR